MKSRTTFILALFCGLSAATAAPTAISVPADFRSGMTVVPEADRPVQQLPVPDPVYAGTQRADLSDVQVFNGSGIAVPFAFCPPPIAASGIREIPLPVYPLKADTGQRSGATRIRVQDGRAVEVQVDGAATTVAEDLQTSGFVVDARAAADAIRALRLTWSSPDGASELQVRVDGSNDLQNWVPLASSASLLQSDAAIALPDAGATGSAQATPDRIERARIPLAESRVAYLKITRTDSGPAPRISSAVAEVTLPAPDVARTSIATQPMTSEIPGEFEFDAGHRAPVDSAQVGLPQQNMRLSASLLSRPTSTGPWRTVWSGEIYALGAGESALHSPDARFATDPDRYWKLSIRGGAATLGIARPALGLAYRPAMLRFLAQGPAPFRLAFGSGRVSANGASPCTALVADLDPNELGRLTGSATTGVPMFLGGDAALLPPPPPPLPPKPILLWGVLVAGAGLLVAMALSLLRRSGPPPID